MIDVLQACQRKLDAEFRWKIISEIVVRQI